MWSGRDPSSVGGDNEGNPPLTRLLVMPTSASSLVRSTTWNSPPLPPPPLPLSFLERQARPDPPLVPTQSPRCHPYPFSSPFRPGSSRPHPTTTYRPPSSRMPRPRHCQTRRSPSRTRGWAPSARWRRSPRSAVAAGRARGGGRVKGAGGGGQGCWSDRRRDRGRSRTRRGRSPARRGREGAVAGWQERAEGRSA